MAGVFQLVSAGNGFKRGRFTRSYDWAIWKSSARRPSSFDRSQNWFSKSIAIATNNQQHNYKNRAREIKMNVKNSPALKSVETRSIAALCVLSFWGSASPAQDAHSLLNRERENIQSYQTGAETAFVVTLVALSAICTACFFGVRALLRRRNNGNHSKTA